MDIVNQFKSKAKAIAGSIVLPEATDERTLQATETILKEGMAKVVLVGDITTISELAKEKGYDITGANIIDPNEFKDIDKYTEFFFKKREKKGITMEQAAEVVRTPLFFGALLVKFGEVNGMVAGAQNTTGAVLRAALQVVGVKPGLKTVSSSFIMVTPDFLGEDKIFLFGDCAVVPNPTAEQLADIAISTAGTRKSLIGDEPKVALLSFSTKGSAEHELVDKVRAALKIVQDKNVDFQIDGEMQADAAIIPAIGSKKAPGSNVAGEANVLIFPDLQAGNIGYKLVQRFAKAEAIGPVIQGLAAPICDLSRGCSAEDIVNTSALVLLMSK
ncbi:MAG: phosphate acetyltransferase [Candidatus Cloacimonetes bacterium 4572_65]|nr:MAG: phosphate acetyltransferase [Candidatus Cloacimonetes bacterium 4572_65]